MIYKSILAALVYALMLTTAHQVFLPYLSKPNRVAALTAYVTPTLSPPDRSPYTSTPVTFTPTPTAVATLTPTSDLTPRPTVTRFFATTTYTPEGTLPASTPYPPPATLQESEP